MMKKDPGENRPAVAGSGTGAPGDGRLRRDDRFERIMAVLRVGSSLRVADLAARFGVSTETVRRDLDELSRQGLVDRTFGGAAPAISFHELAVDARASGSTSAGASALARRG
jgi:DNA-binding IclR family transcriptional regulator